MNDAAIIALMVVLVACLVWLYETDRERVLGVFKPTMIASVVSSFIAGLGIILLNDAWGVFNGRKVEKSA
jgi:hypothetical protein